MNSGNSFRQATEASTVNAATHKGFLHRIPYSQVNTLGASVAIVEAHDVVLAEVRAALHLDQHQVARADVGQPMPLAERDEAVLPRPGGELLRAHLHQRLALHHDPMLAALVVAGGVLVLNIKHDIVLEHAPEQPLPNLA